MVLEVDEGGQEGSGERSRVGGPPKISETHYNTIQNFTEVYEKHSLHDLVEQIQPKIYALQEIDARMSKIFVKLHS